MTEAVKPIKNADGLLNQWAKDAAGRLIHASLCVVGAAYICPLPGCGQEIRVRATDSKHYRPHLYHSEQLCTATGESNEHNLAKNIVAQRLRDWLTGEKTAPFIGMMCNVHLRVFDVFGPLAGATSVDIEGIVGTRKADVLLHRGNEPPFAFEVHFTNAVDETKADELAALGVSWIELDALQVIAGNPWVYNRGAAPVPACPLCETDKEILAAHAKAKAANEEAVRAAAAKAQAAHERRETEGWVRVEREKAERVVADLNNKVKEAVDNAALAHARAFSAELEAKERIEHVQRESPRLCVKCDLPIHADAPQDEEHPAILSRFSPDDRDHYRAVHGGRAA